VTRQCTFQQGSRGGPHRTHTHTHTGTERHNHSRTHRTQTQTQTLSVRHVQHRNVAR
jgi:hypothetical protein